jgi:hypothetical protein
LVLFLLAVYGLTSKQLVGAPMEESPPDQPGV